MLEIRPLGLENKRLLAPWADLSVLRYYFTRAKLQGYAAPGRFDAMLQPGLRIKIEIIQP